MAQIPLERTIGDTYRFALRNVLSIFGIAWFPILLMIATVAAAAWWLWPDLAGFDWSEHADAAPNQEAGGAARVQDIRRRRAVLHFCSTC